MSVSPQTQAVLLLTAHLAKPGRGDPRPLSPNEWGRLALWLQDHTLQPQALLSEDPARLLAGWLDKTVTVHRIEALLGRGGALGLALEKWQRAGLWMMTCSDPDYPKRLKQRLGSCAPPLLFGCGSRDLLSKGGVAIVGSRDATDDDLSFAATLGIEASSHALSVVSGGARGVDEAAMLGALEHDGTAVGVLAEGLLRAATSAKYREHLVANKLVLISPFNPEAGFDVGNAMARNRYIYCLAGAAVVVSSMRDKGGTWAGAIENLKERWVPLWVNPCSNPDSGNTELVQRGARRLPHERDDFSALFSTGEDPTSSGTKHAELDLRIMTAQRRDGSGVESRGTDKPQAQPVATAAESKSPQFEEPTETLSYEPFLLRMKIVAGENALTVEQLLHHFDITKPTLNARLKRAVSEGRVEKLSKPVRYRWQGAQPQQHSMFADDERGHPPRIRKA